MRISEDQGDAAPSQGLLGPPRAGGGRKVSPRSVWKARTAVALGSQASGVQAGRGDGLLDECLCFQPLTYGRLLQQTQDTHRPRQPARGGRLMLGKIEGKRRRGQQRVKWLDGITYSMDVNLSKL